MVAKGSARPDPADETRKEGLLQVVGTPIGNLEDITLRALRVLREADCILAEDTRRTRILCAHHCIGTRLRSLHAHSEMRQQAPIIAALLAGARYALVSDAGTPTINDPGSLLVRAAIDAGIAVQAIPGACAVVAALSIAGLPPNGFRFVGFVPRRKSERQRLWSAIASEKQTTVFFESPKRLRASLLELAPELAPARRMVVCRELTKRYEEAWHMSAASLPHDLAALPEIRGEITVLIDGCGEEPQQQHVPAEAVLREQVQQRLTAGQTRRDIARWLTELGVERKRAYALSLATPP